MSETPDDDALRAILTEINIRSGAVLPSMKSRVEQEWFRAGPCRPEDLQTVRILRSEGTRI